MFHNQRLIWGTTEISAELNDFRSGTKAFPYVTGGFLYVGQEKPFNNIWFETSTANASGSAVSVSVWYANAWNSVVDVSDGTVSGSTSLAQSGRLSWNTPWNKSWDNMDRCSLITGLETFEIYDLYWARLAWDGNFSAGTILSYIGQKFASETELNGLYPDTRQSVLKTAFGGNTKTTWDAELYAASDQVINDLKARQLIEAKGQIVDWTIFCEPCIHKTAEIIYRGLGQQFRQAMVDARDAYNDSMKKDKFRIDKDGDGKLSVHEKKASTGFFKR